MMRHIILAIDGTNNSAARGNTENFTNAFRMIQALTPASNASHNNIVPIYVPGPGSRNAAGKLFNMMLAAEFESMLKEAYLELCLTRPDQNKDKIYIFGYSRGAIVAKALTRLIDMCGILQPQHLHYVNNAYQYYKHEESQQHSFFRRIKRIFNIKFVGLFDPVAGPKNVFTRIVVPETVPSAVEHAVELLAINERRILFNPHIWRLPGDASNLLNNNVIDIKGRHLLRKLEQIWIPSCHGDIADQKCKSIFTDIALLTMLERLVGHTSIPFNDIYVKNLYDRVMAEKGDVIFTESGWYLHKERIIPRLITSFTHPLHRIQDGKRGHIGSHIGIYKRSLQNASTLSSLSEYNFDLGKILPTVNGNAGDNILDCVDTMISQIR